MLKPEFFAEHPMLISMCMNAYSETHRMYHTFGHISNMLTGYSKLVKVGEVEYDERDVLIIMFHDYIYEIGSSSNESNSAKAAEVYMTRYGGYSDEDIKYVALGIMATKEHIPTGIVNHSFILDLDLESLGKSWDLYALNGNALRYEYRSKFTTKEVRMGRKKWLTFFLSRNSIYSTELFYDKYEIVARENLTRDLNTLKK